MNDVSLKEYLESLVRERTQRIDERLDGMAQAIVVAKAETERRLEELNQLRKDVIIDRNAFVRTDVYYPRQQALEKDVVALATRQTKTETRSITWTAALGVGFLLVGLLMRYLKL